MYKIRKLILRTEYNNIITKDFCKMLILESYFFEVTQTFIELNNLAFKKSVTAIMGTPLQLKRINKYNPWDALLLILVKVEL